MALEITFRHKFAVQKLFLNIPFQVFLYHGKLKLNLNFHCVFFLKPAFNTFYLDLSLNIMGGNLCLYEEEEDETSTTNSCWLKQKMTLLIPVQIFSLVHLPISSHKIFRRLNKKDYTNYA